MLSEMTPLVSAIILFVGLVVLVGAGDALVRGASSLARRAGMSPLLIGLTIIAFGTSAPELVVSVEAILEGHPTLALGNIVGSNIANVLLVLGLPALFAPIAAGPDGVRRNAVIGVVAAIVLIALAAQNGLVFWEGAVLFAGIIAYLLYMARLAMGPNQDPVANDLIELDDDDLLKSWPMIWLFVAVGALTLPIGAWMIVTGGVSLGEAMGFPPELVGLTAVALGTSLPELAATAAAALRRQTDLAIGNVLGSNIFNIFAVGGVAAMFGTIPTPDTFMRFDFWVMLGAALVLLLVTTVRRGVPRLVGGVFLAAYVAYILGAAHMNGVIALF